MLKRLFDFIFSLLILTVSSPLLLLIAILIRVTSPGPIFFVQKRLGKNGEPFNIYKFRTMIVGADQNSDHLTLIKDPRITKIGRILRKLNLDELPQFFNVIKGEMSLVGPRPDVPQYYDLTNKLHQKVLSIKPGITCFASIEFSLSQKQEAEILAKAEIPEKLYYEVISPQKMALNLEYVENQSLWLDLEIIGRTIYFLLKNLLKFKKK